MAASGSGASEIDSKCINTIRCLAADMVQKANSGHPGAPIGCAPIAHLLWTKVMSYDPAAPDWAGRDRFVLSNGHACALLYSMLHLTGYDLPMSELQQFRQVGSVTAGHPENELHPAIEVSTGPLGQGISNAVGLAMAQTHMAATYSEELFSNFTYVLCGDGCLQEGVSGEACSLAGHLGLGRLIVLYDDNSITIDGPTSLSFSEDVGKRYESYGWQVLSVGDGDSDLSAIEAAISEAQADTSRPTLIRVKTTIGFASDVAGSEKAHGAPLGKEGVASLKTALGFDPEKHFYVPEDVAAHFSAAGGRGKAAHEAWDAKLAEFTSANAEKGAELSRRLRGEFPEGWEECLPTFVKGEAKEDATRGLSGTVLNALAERLPELMGGSADLTPSNKTLLKCSGDFQKETPAGRYIRFGVREHGMTAIANGIAAYGGIIPYVASFLVFVTSYAAGAVRVTALSHRRVLFIATHDSIGLGEDGPTHQPIESLAWMRSLPNMATYRPADGNEVSAAYAEALSHHDRPAVLALSRQKVSTLAHSTIARARRGGYVVWDSADPGDDKIGDAWSVPEGAPDVVLLATGTEVNLAVEAAEALAAGGGGGGGEGGDGLRTRVVSLPCLEDFAAQDAEYRDSVLPRGVTTISVEAATSFGWERYSHAHVGIDTFGASGPGAAVYEHFGITKDAIVEKARALRARFVASVPTLPCHY